MEYRFLVKEDGEAFLDLMLSLDEETKFMMYEPGERDSTSDMMCNRIEGMNESASIVTVS